MSSNVVETVIVGNLEALDQGLELVKALTDKQYNYIAKPYVLSV